MRKVSIMKGHAMRNGQTRNVDTFCARYRTKSNKTRDNKVKKNKNKNKAKNKRETSNKKKTKKKKQSTKTNEYLSLSNKFEDT